MIQQPNISRRLVSGGLSEGSFYKLGLDSSLKGRVSRGHCSPVVMQSGNFLTNVDQGSMSRRKQGMLMIASVVSLGIFAEPSHAFGKSAKELAREAKERRAKLKETAGKMRSAGKASDAFESSNYSVPEEATTPNVVNRNRNID